MTYSKYRAIKSGGFASKLEHSVHRTLLLEQAAGLIRIEALQPNVLLSRAQIKYIPDFKIFDLNLNETVFVEAKGFETPEWRIKLKLWRAYGPGILRIVKGSAQRIYISEVVPKGLYCNESSIKITKERGEKNED